MAIALNKVNVSEFTNKGGSSGKRTFARITRTKTGYRSYIAPDILKALKIDESYIKDDTKGIGVAKDADNHVVLYRQDDSNSTKISGNMETPTAYSTAFARVILDIVGAKIQLNQSCSFYGYENDTDEESGEAVIILKKAYQGGKAL